LYNESLCLAFAYTHGNGDRDGNSCGYGDTNGNCYGNSGGYGDTNGNCYGDPDGNSDGNGYADAYFDAQTYAYATGSTDAETASVTGAASHDQADLPLAAALTNAVSLELHAAFFGNSRIASRVP